MVLRGALSPVTVQKKGRRRGKNSLSYSGISGLNFAMARPLLPANKLRRRPPFFRPVSLRPRADGWTEQRQCGLLAALYVTVSIAQAARSVGMTRESAHRLRRREGAESFAAAWDRVFDPPGSGKAPAWRPDFRKVTLATLTLWLETGFVQPVIYRGRMVAIRRKVDNGSLFRVLARTAKADDLGSRGSPA